MSKLLGFLKVGENYYINFNIVIRILDLIIKRFLVLFIRINNFFINRYFLSFFLSILGCFWFEVDMLIRKYIVK